ncbi:thioredoxin-disulfide reductase [Thermoproteota archaeon]
MTEKVIIIGSGPAAHTAAIYTSRAQLNPLLFEGMMAGGIAPGGQLTTTTEIENFPGFPDKISGMELMTRMREQSLKYGTRIQTKTVDKVDLSSQPFRIYCGQEEFQAQTVIVATGATAKRLHIPGEDNLWQKGISACAICDGGLPVFRNKQIFVVGGGDTAIEEAVYLTNFASHVTLVVRRDELRASKAMQNRLKANDKITVIWNSFVTEAVGDTMLTHLKIKNKLTNEETLVESSGLFYAIGHSPNSAFLEGQITTDETGYIVTKPGTTKTNIPGVFACGDIQDKVYRQAITAAGTGCMAGLEAERYLNQH